MAIAPKVLHFLEEKGIHFELVAHPRTYSSHDSAVAAHVEDDHLAKAVVLRDDAGYLQFVIPASQWLKLHGVRDAFARPLDFAEEDELDGIYEDCASGAVPAVGQAYGVETGLDNSLTTLANVFFEAGDHEHLVHVSGDQFAELMQGLRRGYFTEEN